MLSGSETDLVNLKVADQDSFNRRQADTSSLSAEVLPGIETSVALLNFYEKTALSVPPVTFLPDHLMAILKPGDECSLTVCDIPNEVRNEYLQSDQWKQFCREAAVDSLQDQAILGAALLRTGNILFRRSWIDWAPSRFTQFLKHELFHRTLFEQPEFRQLLERAYQDIWSSRELNWQIAIVFRCHYGTNPGSEEFWAQWTYPTEIKAAESDWASIQESVAHSAMTPTVKEALSDLVQIKEKIETEGDFLYQKIQREPFPRRSSSPS